MAFSVVPNEPKVAMAWAALRWPGTPQDHDWGPHNTIHLERDGCITAVVVYNSYIRATSIDMHVAASVTGRWLTRPFLAATFKYPFEQLGVRRVTARIGANNLKAKHFLESLGFLHEGTIRKGWEPDIDLLIYGLLKEECRFLGHAYNGKTVSTGRARSRRDSERTGCEQ